MYWIQFNVILIVNVKVVGGDKFIFMDRLDLGIVILLCITKVTSMYSVVK